MRNPNYVLVIDGLLVAYTARSLFGGLWRGMCILPGGLAFCVAPLAAVILWPDVFR